MRSYGIVKKISDIPGKDFTIATEHMSSFWAAFNFFQQKVARQGHSIRAEQVTHQQSECVVRVYYDDEKILNALKFVF